MSTLEAHELTVLLRGGDPKVTSAAPVWRTVKNEKLGIIGTGP